MKGLPQSAHLVAGRGAGGDASFVGGAGNVGGTGDGISLISLKEAPMRAVASGLCWRAEGHPCSLLFGHRHRWTRGGVAINTHICVFYPCTSRGVPWTMDGLLHLVQGPLREVRTNDSDRQLLLVPDAMIHVQVPTSYYPSQRLHPKVTAERALSLLADGWVPVVPAIRRGEVSWAEADRSTARLLLQQLDAVQRASDRG